MLPFLEWPLPLLCPFTCLSDAVGAGGPRDQADDVADGTGVVVVDGGVAVLLIG
jgi:hypothetical protein